MVVHYKDYIYNLCIEYQDKVDFSLLKVEKPKMFKGCGNHTCIDLETICNQYKNYLSNMVSFISTNLEDTLPIYTLKMFFNQLLSDEDIKLIDNNIVYSDHDMTGIILFGDGFEYHVELECDDNINHLVEYIKYKNTYLSETFSTGIICNKFTFLNGKLYFNYDKSMLKDVLIFIILKQ